MSLDADVEDTIKERGETSEQPSKVEIYITDKVVEIGVHQAVAATPTEQRAVDVYRRLAKAISEGNWSQAERQLRKISTNVPGNQRYEVTGGANRGSIGVTDDDGFSDTVHFEGSRGVRHKTPLSELRNLLPGVRASERDRIVSLFERLVEARQQEPIYLKLGAGKTTVQYNF